MTGVELLAMSKGAVGNLLIIGAIVAVVLAVRFTRRPPVDDDE